MTNDRSAARRAMVEIQLERRDITDERVLDAMRTVPRHDFVPTAVADRAYEDRPLPIGFDATISQPYIVALMTQVLSLQPTDRVLEVGTGSGYGAAVLAEIAAEVITVETVPVLADQARARLADRYADRVTVITGDGSVGYEPGAPYDAISVTAAAPEIPPPLLEQLAIGGRMVIPVGRGSEELMLVHRTEAGFDRRGVLPVRFVPLTGRHGLTR